MPLPLSRSGRTEADDARDGNVSPGQGGRRGGDGSAQGRPGRRERTPRPGRASSRDRQGSRATTCNERPSPGTYTWVPTSWEGHAMSTSQRFLLSVGLLAAGLVAATDARPTTWNVPADAATLQAGIALGAPGDTIEVDPGTYSGPGNRDVDFGGKALVLRSVAGAAVTILDCQASGRGLVFQAGEGNAAVVEGFTITNGRVARGGAIFCSGAAPTIRDCVLIANRADETGGGISCMFGAFPRLERCRFEANTAFFSGGAMSLINASAAITDCLVTGNSAGILGGGIYCREASPTITGTLVVDNQSNGAGGGLVIYHLSAPVIT